MNVTWIDRAIGKVAPAWQLRRVKARVAVDLLRRHYEGAGTGRRTQGWRRSSADANSVIGPALQRLRENSRDLVRNNPYAESALGTIADHTVGWGIVAKPKVGTNQKNAALDAWRQWAETTACDADGRHDFYGLQKMVMRTVVESGECLVRLRRRLPEDNLPLPLQLQILEPDFLDTAKDTGLFPIGRGLNRIIQGVEFDAIGRRVAYWLFPEHPGSASGMATTSVRVPAEFVLHIFKPIRPNQVRGVSWFAPVLLRFKDFDEFEDATLMKQKVAACLAVIESDVDSGVGGLGTVQTGTTPEIDSLEPGAIIRRSPGSTIQVVQPPRVDEYSDYASNVLRAIATGLGVTYEDLTGNYTDLPFSAARMSRLRHEARIHDWRWRILIPQFCDPVWATVMASAQIAGQIGATVPAAEWTPPPLPLVDPDKEGIAQQRNIRTGLASWQEVIRERGRDPEEVLQEMVEDTKRFDQLGIILDCDPRKMTQAGQLQGSAAATARDGRPNTATEDADEERRRRLPLHAVGYDR